MLIKQASQHTASAIGQDQLQRGILISLRQGNADALNHERKWTDAVGHAQRAHRNQGQRLFGFRRHRSMAAFSQPFHQHIHHRPERFHHIVHQAHGVAFVLVEQRDAWMQPGGDEMARHRRTKHRITVVQ